MAESCNISPRPKTFREWIRSSRFWKHALSLIIGGGLGYLYYHFEGMGAAGGIGSDPYSAVLFGSFMIWFLVNRPCCSCRG